MRELHKFLSSLLSWFNSPLFGFLLVYRIIFWLLTYLRWTFVPSETMTVNIRIIWTCQGAFPAPELLVWFWWILWKSKSCQAPAVLHPKKPLGRSFPFFLFLLHLFGLYCKTSSLILSIVILDEWWHHQQFLSSVLLPEPTAVCLKYLKDVLAPPQVS